MSMDSGPERRSACSSGTIRSSTADVEEDGQIEEEGTEDVVRAR